LHLLFTCFIPALHLLLGNISKPAKPLLLMGDLCIRNFGELWELWELWGTVGTLGTLGNLIFTDDFHKNNQ
jgi:hypothetical protein